MSLKTLAIDYTTSYDYSVTPDTASDGSWAAFSGGLIGLWLVIAVIIIAGMWKAFAKARKPGWAAIIPIYNTYVMIKIAGRPGWWLILFFIPFVNFIMSLVVSYDLAKTFGKGVGYMLLLVFLPFIGWPMLGFGDAKYKKPKAA